jgi:DNA mismatch repair protein PMS2
LTGSLLSLTHIIFLVDAIFQVGVTINLIDIVSGREDVSLATSSTSTKIEETVSAVMGHKFLSTLTPINVDLGKILNEKNDEDNVFGWGIKGLLSKNPQASSSGRTINCYSINGRVVELPKVTAILRKIWSGFGGKKKPSCVLSFTLPNDKFDINLSPDKQQVLLSDEQEILQLIQQDVTQLFSSQLNGVFQAQQLDVPTDYNLEEAEDAGDGERQKHKRRFAFVHDLSKAKLQHDLADRESFQEKEDENDHDKVEEQQPLADPKQVVELDTPEAPPSKKPKVATSQSDTTSTQTEKKAKKIYDFGTHGPSFRLPEKASDLERRKWTSIQSKFQNDSSHDDIQSTPSKSQPVSPYDPLPNATVEYLETEAEKIETSSQKIRSEQRKAAEESKKLSSLGKFMHQPHGKHSSNGKTTVEKQPRPLVENTSNRDMERSTRNHRQKQIEDDGEEKATTDKVTTSQVARAFSGPSTSEESEIPKSIRKAGSNTEAVDEATAAKPIVEQDQSISNESGQELSDDGDEPPTTPSVVWKCFQGTEQVSCSARQERLQMLHRKKDHVQVRNQAGKDSTMERGAEDVSKSVGSQQFSKGDVVSLSKSDFQDGRLKVLGQFNLGFILCLSGNNNLWILDQHACDEKFNFEALCRDTVFHEQKLLRPMPLDLSPSEEACILDHMDVFEANGFHFEFRPEAPIRKRLFLTALPHSGAQDGRKAVQFGKEDVSALCSMLSEGSAYEAGDGGTGTDGSGKSGNNAVRRYASTASSQSDSVNRLVARLPKAIAMFASRACRSSIMIGTALSQKEMEKIVTRLSDVEHPWNCPHGRPTIRHVGDVLPVMMNDERKAAEHITGPTATMTPMTQEDFADN